MREKSAGNLHSCVHMVARLQDIIEITSSYATFVQFYAGTNVEEFCFYIASPPWVAFAIKFYIVTFGLVLTFNYI
jgi:hypothetical protein